MEKWSRSCSTWVQEEGWKVLLTSACSSPTTKEEEQKHRQLYRYVSSKDLMSSNGMSRCNLVMHSLLMQSTLPQMSPLIPLLSKCITFGLHELFFCSCHTPYKRLCSIAIRLCKSLRRTESMLVACWQARVKRQTRRSSAQQGSGKKTQSAHKVCGVYVKKGSCCPLDLA